MTKSPPIKRVKEHHVEDMDTDPLDIVKQKDVEIMDLKSTISQLKQKLQNFEDSIAKTQIHLEYTFKCEKCDKQFTIKNDMLDHMKEHIVHKKWLQLIKLLFQMTRKTSKTRCCFQKFIIVKNVGRSSKTNLY